MSSSDFRFSHRMRVRYSEVDPQAVVFHARYLDYADVAVTEYWRGFGLSVLPSAEQPEFQLVRAEVVYKAPIRLDEEIRLLVRASQIGRTSMTTLIEIHGADGDDLRAQVQEVHVNVDLASGRGTPVPADLIERIEEFEGRSISVK
jgi:acyl-CoA thioester hydrolase